MLHVSRRELKSAFSRSSVGRQKASECDSHLLLLVYAAECGLKLALLVQRNIHSTQQLSDDDLTHDLDLLLSRICGGMNLRIGHVRDSEGNAVAPDEWHQALRYGRRLEIDSRQKLVTALGRIEDWIKDTY